MKKNFKAGNTVVANQVIFHSEGLIEKGEVALITEVKEWNDNESIRTSLHPSWWVPGSVYDYCDKDYVPYEDCEI